MNPPNRRAYKRTSLRMPLEFWPADGRTPSDRRLAFTQDISPSGVRFDADPADIGVGSLLNLQLKAPPGPGHFPFPVDLMGIGRVVRIEPGSDGESSAQATCDSGPGCCVCAEFTRPLRLLAADR
jgi:hypothetical protein